MSGSRMETSTVPLYAHTYQQPFGSSSYSIHTAQMIGLLAFHSLAITLIAWVWGTTVHCTDQTYQCKNCWSIL